MLSAQERPNQHLIDLDLRRWHADRRHALIAHHTKLTTAPAGPQTAACAGSTAAFTHQSATRKWADHSARATTTWSSRRSADAARSFVATALAGTASRNS